MTTKEEVKQEKENLEKAIAANDSEATLKSLQNLTKFQVTLDIIKETKIGKVVGKLRKHSSQEIVTTSNTLVNEWKKMVEKKSDKSEKEDKKKETEDKKRKKEEPSKKEEPKKRKEGTAKSQSTPSYGGNDLRRKVVEMLESSLQPPKPDNDVVSIDTVAQAIEAELFRLWPDCGKDYKAKFRSLLFNLKNPKNPDLRDSVMNEALSPEKLCGLTTHQMASEDLKAERKRIADWHLEAAKTKVNATSTNMFKCSKCQKRETTYYQLQTRSSDEPMTTFHTCTNCGNRWKS